MKFLFQFFFFLSFSTMLHSTMYNDIVGAAGRLGDQLNLYIKTKWIAKKTNSPFVLVPFRHSEKFTLYDKEKKLPFLDFQQLDLFSLGAHNKFDLTFFLFKQNQSYRIGRLSTYQGEVEICQWAELLDDKEFLDEIKQLLQPKKKYQFKPLPENIPTVAVHIRRGRDDEILRKSTDFRQKQRKRKKIMFHLNETSEPFMDIHFPLKFPPLQYYLDQLIYLQKKINKKIFVKIFTDTKNPKEPYLKLLSKLDPNLFILTHNIVTDKDTDKSFVSNPLLYHPDTDPIKDLVDMSRFDYLIRSMSSYSQILDFMSDFKEVIFPTDFSWINNKFLNITKTVKKEKDVI